MVQITHQLSIVVNYHNTVDRALSLPKMPDSVGTQLPPSHLLLPPSVHHRWYLVALLRSAQHTPWRSYRSSLPIPQLRRLAGGVSPRKSRWSSCHVAGLTRDRQRRPLATRPPPSVLQKRAGIEPSPRGSDEWWPAPQGLRAGYNIEPSAGLKQ